MGIIDAGVVFIVMYMLFMLSRLFILPHLKVGLPALEPAWFWGMVYGTILAASSFLFHFILIFLAIVYVVWVFIRKFVINFPVPFRSILLRLPPFRQLEQAGVLPFIHTIVTTILSKLPFADRLKRVFEATGTFFYNSTLFLVAKLGPKRPPKETNYTSPTEPDEDAEDNMSPEELERLHDAQQMCLAENTQPISADMSALEKAAVLTKNNSAATICKARQFVLYSKILADRDSGHKKKKKHRN